MARNATTFTGGFGSSFSGNAETDRKRGKQASPLDVPSVSNLYQSVQNKPNVEVPAPAPPQLPSIGRAGSNMGPSIDEQVLREVSKVPTVSNGVVGAQPSAATIPGQPTLPLAQPNYAATKIANPTLGAAPSESLLQYYQRLYGQSASEIYNGLLGAGVSQDAAKKLMASAGIPQGDIDAALAFGQRGTAPTVAPVTIGSDVGNNGGRGSGRNTNIVPSGDATSNISTTGRGSSGSTIDNGPNPPFVDTTEPVVWNIPASALIDSATVEAIQPIGTEELDAIRSTFDTELQSAIADANRDYVAGQESLQTQGIGAGSPAAYNSAAARLTQDNINSIYDVRIATATAKATALANQIISTKTEARARVDDLVKSIDSAAYEDLPMIFTTLLIPNMRAAGYSTQTIQNSMNTVAVQGWDDAMRYTVSTFDGSLNDLVTALRRHTYPNGTSPTEEDVRGWLNMNSNLTLADGTTVADATNPPEYGRTTTASGASVTTSPR